MGKRHRSGQLLLEVLFTIAVAGIILGVGGNLVFVGLRSNSVSIERDVALGLVDETFAAVRANAFEKWTCKDYAGNNTSGTCPITSPSFVFYDVTKGSSALYYPVKDSFSGLSYKWVDHSDEGTWGTDNIRAISALAPNDVWIISVTGRKVFHYDGELWAEVTGLTPAGDLRDIVTISPTNVWVVGDGAGVYQYNGSTWTTHSPSGLSGDIKAVSAPSANKVWIAGHSGEVWVYDGVSAWTEHSGSGRWGTGALLKDVSALGSDAWVVGASGAVWKYVSGSWSQESGSGKWGATQIKTVSFLSSNETWIAGDQGNVWRHKDGSWTQFTGGWDTTSQVISISAYSSNSVLFVQGSGLWKYDGTNWTQYDNSLAWGSGGDLANLTDSFSNELWVVGYPGLVWTYKAARWDIKQVSTETDDDVILNGTTYSRNFYVQNVCRSSSTGDITTTTTSAGVDTACASGSDYYDHSTAKVTVTVSWGGDSVSSSEYIARSANAACEQTQWSTDIGDNILHTCPTTDYESQTFMTTGTALTITLPLVNAKGTLISTVFDTTKFGVLGEGPAYNFVYTNSTGLDSGDLVRVQIAASDSASGPWTFIGGSACDGSNWFAWAGTATGTAQEIKCPSNFTNKRYFKYKVELCSTATCAGILSDNGPQLENLIIGWNP